MSDGPAVREVQFSRELHHPDETVRRTNPSVGEIRPGHLPLIGPNRATGRQSHPRDQAPDYDHGVVGHALQGCAKRQGLPRYPADFLIASRTLGSLCSALSCKANEAEAAGRSLSRQPKLSGDSFVLARATSPIVMNRTTRTFHIGVRAGCARENAGAGALSVLFNLAAPSSSAWA